MQLSSKVIEHSVNLHGDEIITYELCLPKWLLAEFNTHKAEIERNSASSRAVPTTTIIDMIREFPVMPLEWKYNSKGMVSEELMSDEDAKYANDVWLESRDLMIKQIEKLRNLPSGRQADKQRTNRLLEPWMWTVVVCTMTRGGGIGMNNFFGLRDKPNVQPEFQYVAHLMHEQFHNNIPVNRSWHLPYITENLVENLRKGTFEIFGQSYNTKELALVDVALVSSARCGRVTHYRQGQEYTLEENITRARAFLEDGHFSPLRHAAKAGSMKWYGNMYGWIPFSKILTNHFDYVTKCCERA